MGHLRYRLTDVPPQSNSPPESVLSGSERRPRDVPREGDETRRTRHVLRESKYSTNSTAHEARKSAPQQQHQQQPRMCRHKTQKRDGWRENAYPERNKRKSTNAHLHRSYVRISATSHQARMHAQKNTLQLAHHRVECGNERNSGISPFVTVPRRTITPT